MDEMCRVSVSRKTHPQGSFCSSSMDSLDNVSKKFKKTYNFNAEHICVLDMCRKERRRENTPNMDVFSRLEGESFSLRAANYLSVA